MDNKEGGNKLNDLVKFLSSEIDGEEKVRLSRSEFPIENQSENNSRPIWHERNIP